MPFFMWYDVATMKIGVMGAKGSFSEKAGEQYVATQGVTDAQILALINAESVLTAVENGACDKGIFPIENSNGGIVIEAVHAMAKHRFEIERMFELDIHHMLLVKPGITAAHITAVSSHDQALKQCRMYLKRVWTEADIIPYADTAKAAADLSSGILPDTTAVIAPRGCADLYGLEILEESIQDLKFNYTTFVVATKLSE
jgi:prephenate dehydratase